MKTINICLRSGFQSMAHTTFDSNLKPVPGKDRRPGFIKAKDKAIPVGLHRLFPQDL